MNFITNTAFFSQKRAIFRASEVARSRMIFHGHLSAHVRPIPISCLLFCQEVQIRKPIVNAGAHARERRTRKVKITADLPGHSAAYAVMRRTSAARRRRTERVDGFAR